MTCPEYDKLVKERKIAQDNVMYFRSANSSLHGQSTAKANQLRKEAQERMFALAEEIALHQTICPHCKDAKG